ncbi:hypothetical protein [Sphingobacterium siyangense]|uniref:hypothetical protein n=1 Tax=Sphingobacterium siyangense TaxID=459529 RepID=UPI00301657AE
MTPTATLWALQKVKSVDQRFHEWLDNINETEKIDKSIVVFNFGLFESAEGLIMDLKFSMKMMTIWLQRGTLNLNRNIFHSVQSF